MSRELFPDNSDTEAKLSKTEKSVKFDETARASQNSSPQSSQFSLFGQVRTPQTPSTPVPARQSNSAIATRQATPYHYQSPMFGQAQTPQTPSTPALVSQSDSTAATRQATPYPHHQPVPATPFNSPQTPMRAVPTSIDAHDCKATEIMSERYQERVAPRVLEFSENIEIIGTQAAPTTQPAQPQDAPTNTGFSP